MSHEKFELGEVAELVYSRYHRDPACVDALIVGPLDYRLNRITMQLELSYAIEVEGKKYLALPDQLRKKRPPQDWISLCHLDTVPADELEIA